MAAGQALGFAWAVGDVKHRHAGLAVNALQQPAHLVMQLLVQRTKRLHVHDEENTLNIGDRVRVQETRPLSKNKRWRLVEILERAK